LNFWIDDKKHPGFFFPPFRSSRSFFSFPLSRLSLRPGDPSSIRRLSLSQTRRSFVHPAPVPLRLPLTLRRASLSPPPSRLALSHSSDSSPATQPGRKADPNQRQFSGDPRCPVPRRPKPLQDSPATPNGNTASISIFFFLGLFCLFYLTSESSPATQGVLFSADPNRSKILRRPQTVIPLPSLFFFFFFFFFFFLGLFGLFDFVVIGKCLVA
jgi:hypothetical protein